MLRLYRTILSPNVSGVSREQPWTNRGRLELPGYWTQHGLVTHFGSEQTIMVCIGLTAMEGLKISWVLTWFPAVFRIKLPLWASNFAWKLRRFYMYIIRSGLRGDNDVGLGENDVYQKFLVICTNYWELELTKPWDNSEAAVEESRPFVCSSCAP